MTFPISDELISAYLDGEVTADEQVRVEQAMRDDSELRGMFQELRTLRTMFQSLPALDPTTGFVDRVMTQIQSQQAGLSQETANRCERCPAKTSGDAPQTIVKVPILRWSFAFSMITSAAAIVLAVVWVATVAPQKVAELDTAKSRHYESTAAPGTSSQAGPAFAEAPPVYSLQLEGELDSADSVEGVNRGREQTLASPPNGPAKPAVRPRSGNEEAVRGRSTGLANHNGQPGQAGYGGNTPVDRNGKQRMAGERLLDRVIGGGASLGTGPERAPHDTAAKPMEQPESGSHPAETRSRLQRGQTQVDPTTIDAMVDQFERERTLLLRLELPATAQQLRPSENAKTKSEFGPTSRQWYDTFEWLKDRNALSPERHDNESSDLGMATFNDRDESRDPQLIHLRATESEIRLILSNVAKRPGTAVVFSIANSNQNPTFFEGEEAELLPQPTQGMHVGGEAPKERAGAGANARDRSAPVPTSSDAASPKARNLTVPQTADAGTKATDTKPATLPQKKGVAPRLEDGPRTRKDEPLFTEGQPGPDSAEDPSSHPTLGQLRFVPQILASSTNQSRQFLFVLFQLSATPNPIAPNPETKRN